MRFTISGRRRPRVAVAAAAATSAPAAESIREIGSFAYGACPHCAWLGPGRRSRESARRDHELHAILGCDPHCTASVDVHAHQVAGHDEAPAAARVTADA